MSRYIYEDDDSSFSSGGHSDNTNYQALMHFRKDVKAMKPEIWNIFKEAWLKARDIEVINDLIRKIEGYSKKFREMGIDDPRFTSSIIFPLSESDQIRMLLYPILIAYFCHWRLDKEWEKYKMVDFPEPWFHFSELRPKRPVYKAYLLQFPLFLEATGHRSFLNLDPHWNSCAALVTRNVLRTIMERRLKYVMPCDMNPISFSYNEAIFNMFKRFGVSIKKVEGVQRGLNQICKDMIDIITPNFYHYLLGENYIRPTLQLVMNYYFTQTNDYGKEKFTVKLISDIKEKLLIASIDTKEIVEKYASCVRMLKKLDEHGATMHRVCAVIKEYLKKRPDTIQQIINFITVDRHDLTHRDYANSQGTIIDDEELNTVNDEFLPENRDMTNFNAWNPDPIEFLTNGVKCPTNREVDMFNMLVSIFGSKDLFVKEYRSLLAERLCGSECNNVEMESGYLALLKLRFQDSELQSCDVMLQDLEQSLKVDKKMNRRTSIPMSACVVSAHYWPKIEIDKGEPAYPNVLRGAMACYEDTYKSLRENRKLKWLNGVGCVDIKLELDGVVVEKVVPNIYASILYLFLEKESWKPAEVAEKLNISTVVANRRLEWWAKQGLLVWQVGTENSPEEFFLTRNASSLTALNSKLPDPIDEEAQEVEEANDIIDSLEQFWKYTLNYIKNNAPNGEVKAERMHRLYKMFGSPSSAGPTIDHVNTFLQRKVKLGLLTYTNCFYRIHPQADHD